MQIAILVAVVLLIVWYVRLYNKLRRLSVKVEEGSAGIDVALEKRYDMLSEEIEAVKKFLQHEQEVYTSVTAIRTGQELGEKSFEQKKELSQEVVQTIQQTIQQQQEQMKEIKQKMNRQSHRKSRAHGNKNEENAAGMVEQQMSLERKLGLLASVQQGLNGVHASIDALAEQYPVLYSHVSMAHFQRDIFDAEEHLQAARRLYNANVSLYNQKIASFPFLIVAKIHGMNKAEFYEVEEKKKNFQVKF